MITKNKVCFFCANNIKKEINYKDPQMLTRFLSSYAKILPRRRTGTCMKHQRKLANAIKRARYMALIPYTNR
ncbi:MAG: 30S ribosomal protein S18 [Patescibacteria group bacterium]